MECKAVIFDLDGTLLNTLADLSDSVNQVLQEYGYPLFTYEQYRLMIGNGSRSLIQKSLPEGLSDECVNKALALYKKVYAKKYMDKTRPYDGIGELVNALHKRGVKMAVCSNKFHDATVSLIDKNFPKGSFVCIYGERPGTPRKPDPTVVLEISEELNVSASETIFMGDSKTDILTGHNAGMSAVGVLWGFRGKKELSDADLLLEHPMQLLQKASFANIDYSNL